MCIKLKVCKVHVHGHTLYSFSHLYAHFFNLLDVNLTAINSLLWYDNCCLCHLLYFWIRGIPCLINVICFNWDIINNFKNIINGRDNSCRITTNYWLQSGWRPINWRNGRIDGWNCTKYGHERGPYKPSIWCTWSLWGGLKARTRCWWSRGLWLRAQR